MEQNINKKNLIVNIFFALLSLIKGIGLNNNSKIAIILFVLGFVLVVMKIVNEKFRKKEFFLILSITIIGLIDFLINKETTILFTAICLSCLKNCDIKKILKIIFFFRLIAFILMIILPSLRIIEMNTMTFYRNGAFITRYSFGYSHPNLAHSSFAIIVALYTYLNYKKLNVLKIILIEFLNYVLYLYTFSRTGFLMITLLFLIIILSKKFKTIAKLIPKSLNYVFIFSILLSFFVAYFYGKYEILNKVNTILTGRINFMNLVLTRYSIPLFSSNLYENITFDNGYFDLIYNGGLVAFLYYFFIQIKTNNIIKKNGKMEESIFIMFFLIYCLIESYYSSLIMNLGLVFFSLYIFNNEENNKKGENEI